MTDGVMTSEAIRRDVDQIVETGDSIDRTDVGLGMNKFIGEVISEVMQGILTDKIAEESIERSFSRNSSCDRNRSTSNSRSRSGSRASTNGDRTRCFKCREYVHFARDCPTFNQRELEHFQ